ncbi:MAG: methyl-accepting chemotaxis protein [Vulcanimicrobiaceae bacterium]
MHGDFAGGDFTERWNARVAAFQNGLRLTSLASIPSAILVAAVFADFTKRELISVVIAAIILAMVTMMISHAFDRATLGRVRDAAAEQFMTTETAIAKLRSFFLQVQLSFILTYALGGAVVIVVSSIVRGVHLTPNMFAFIAAIATGALLDCVLNASAAEGLIAQLIALFCAERGLNPPVPQHARGEIGRRFFVTMLVVAGVAIFAMAGGALHLFAEVSAKTMTVAMGSRLAIIYTLCAVAVAGLTSLMAARILSHSIARPILHVVDLMERLRVGDLVGSEELQSEPRYAHEAGLLVSAFGDASAAFARIAGAGEGLAAGDLSVRIEPQSTRDVLAHAFKNVLDTIRSVVIDVQATAQVLDTSSHALASRTGEFAGDASANARDLASAANAMATLDDAMTRVASGAGELTSTAGQLRITADRLGSAAQTNAAGLEQLAQTAKATIEAAGEVMRIAGEAGRSADSATAAILQADRTSQDAQTVMSDLVKVIGSLRVSSQEIGAITQKIDEIADQTNLLALNAAIEAARAGEHGRGFAVVADEIRKLADSSATATKEIATLIQSVQTETDRAVNVTRLGSSSVESGREKTSLVADSLAAIVDNVSAVRERIDAVVLAQREQKSATDSLVESTLLVERLTSENAQMAGALSVLATQLEASSQAGSQAVTSTAADVSAVAQRGERIAASTDELRALTGSLQTEAERIRGAVSGFHTDGALGGDERKSLGS